MLQPLPFHLISGWDCCTTCYPDLVATQKTTRTVSAIPLLSLYMLLHLPFRTTCSSRGFTLTKERELQCG